MFESPDALRKFIINLALQMETNGYIEPSKILIHRANLACTTGSEWLEELHEAVITVSTMADFPNKIKQSLAEISKAAKSTTPYGQVRHT